MRQTLKKLEEIQDVILLGNHGQHFLLHFIKYMSPLAYLALAKVIIMNEQSI